MPEKNFNIGEIEILDNENAFHLTYLGNSVLIFHHSKEKDAEKDPSLKSKYFILNYNIYIPSDKPIIETINPAMNFLQGLDKKGVRGQEQALKDADQYEGTIFKGKEFGLEAIGFDRDCDPHEMPFETGEIKKTIQIKKLANFYLSTLFAKICIFKWCEGDFSDYNLPKDPKTQLRIDGYDTNIVQ